MAVILTTTTDIDVTKLKKELEYLTSSGPFVNKVLRVIEIIPGNPGAANPANKTQITLLNALGQEPTESQLAVAQTIADSHLGRNDQKENLNLTAHDTITLATETQGSLLIENVDSVSIGVSGITTTILPKINSTVNVGSATLPIDTIVAKNLIVQDGIQSPDLDDVDSALTDLNNRVVLLEDDPTTKTYVDASITNLIGGAPDLLNTLKELADALGSDPNFATTILSQLSTISTTIASITTRVEDLESSLANLPPPVVSLNELSDVEILSPTSEQVLKYNGTAWINAAPPATFSGSYNDLSDKPTLASFTTLTSPSNGQYLQYNGTAWINADLPVAGMFASGIVSASNQIITGMKTFIGATTSDPGAIRLGQTGYTTFPITTQKYVTLSNISGYLDIDPTTSDGENILRIRSKGDSFNNWNLMVSRNQTLQSFDFGTSSFAGGPLATINIVHSLGVGLTSAIGASPSWIDILARVKIQTGLAAQKGVIIQGTAAQTGNLLEIQNTAGDLLSNISPDGTIHAKRYTETSANQFTTSLTPSSGTLTINSALGSCILGALTASVTSWAFTNVPSENNKITTVSVIISGNVTYTYGSSCSINGETIANGVQWMGGIAPMATSSTDILTFSIIKDSSGTLRVLGSGQSVDVNLDDGIDGSGTANYLSKWVNNNTMTNSAIFESGGNVGIGTTAPNFSGYGNTNLSIRGGSSGIQGVLELISSRPDGAAFAVGDINFFADSNTVGNKNVVQIQARTSGTTANNRGGAIVIGTKLDGGLAQERFSIDHNGTVTISNVPVGGTVLDAQSSSFDGRNARFPGRFIIGSAFNSYPTIGYNAIPQFITGGTTFQKVANDTSWMINFGNSSTMAFQYAGAAAVGTNFTPITLMNINQNGRMGLGTTTQTATLHVVGSTTDNNVCKIVQSNSSLSNDAFTVEIDSSQHNSNLTAAGAFVIKTNGYTGTYGALAVSGQGDVYLPKVTNHSFGTRQLMIGPTGLMGVQTSIRNSKSNIQSLEDVSWLYELTPVKFNYRKKDDTGAYTNEFYEEVDFGLIAEDVEPINEDLCFYNESVEERPLLGIHYNKLIAPLLKAVQKLNTELEILRIEKNALEAAKNDLEQRVLALEQNNS